MSNLDCNQENTQIPNEEEIPMTFGSESEEEFLKREANEYIQRRKTLTLKRQKAKKRFLFKERIIRSALPSITLSIFILCLSLGWLDLQEYRDGAMKLFSLIFFLIGISIYILNIKKITPHRFVLWCAILLHVCSVIFIILSLYIMLH